jgi:hypothetical protein
VVLGAQKNLEDLSPLLASPSRGSDAVQRRFGLLDARAARKAGLLGILIVPITALLIDRDPSLFLQREYFGAGLGLSDLLAYRSLLESVREWPFDAPTMLRFALYLAIPLGSWLGGAFVERLLGAALD